MYLLVMLSLLAAPPAEAGVKEAGSPIEVVKLDTSQAKRVKVVSQEVSRDGHTLTVVLDPKEDHFTIDLEFGPHDFSQVRFVVLHTDKADTVRYFPLIDRGKHHLDLMTMRGVSLSKSGKDTVLTFHNRKVISVLPPGGRMMFHRAYHTPADDLR